ncbi:MAG TPA: HAMP domain-containing sensor histidine kinase [Stellaceae bacterium]|nr:HAMP domain-containing sensor histidine kinase [Stellaceae bacterium]
MANSTTSSITPASVTAGLPAASPAASASAPPPRQRRWRFYRSLAAKVTVLGLIFLAVPIIVYDRFREADETQKALLLRSVREQGRVMTQALVPLLAETEHPALPQLGRVLARFADDLTNVKLLFSPADRPGFYYVASWPAVSSAQLEAERDELSREGVLDRLTQTCEGDLPFALRYQLAGGADEVVTSVTPLRTPAGCWAVVTSFAAGAMPGASLGRPYWESPEVRVAAAIYLAMVLLTFTTFWSIRSGLKRFAERANAIREDRPGGSFSAQNDVPELADVAIEFDRMVEVLAASARDIRRAAEDNAHAFKTPIAVIRQSLEPLKRAVDVGNQRGVRALGLIESSLDKLDGLVASSRRLDEATADLMDTPRSDIDLSNLLVRLLQAQADTLAQRRLQLRGHIRPKVIIHANSEMVETVIENLFENAVSFSPEGEAIGVRLEARDGMAEMLIGDGGPGVPVEHLERIFDRYFSHRPACDASGDNQTHFGIGLWVARRNVEALGGTIEAENRRPNGLLMRVRLPLADMPRLPPAT